MTNDITQNLTLTLTRNGWEVRVSMGMVVLGIFGGSRASKIDQSIERQMK